MYSSKKHRIILLIASFAATTHGGVRTNKAQHNSELALQIASLAKVIEQPHEAPTKTKSALSEFPDSNSIDITKYVVTYLLNANTHEAYRCPYHAANHKDTVGSVEFLA